MTIPRANYRRKPRRERGFVPVREKVSEQGPPPPTATPREAVEEVCFECFGGMAASRSEGTRVHEAYFQSGMVRLERLTHPKDYWRAEINAPQKWGVCSPSRARWGEALREAMDVYLFALRRR